MPSNLAHVLVKLREYVPALLILFAVISIKAFYDGRRDSPDYSTSRDSYMFILVSYKIKAIDEEGATLYATAGSTDYVYNLRDDSVVTVPTSRVAPNRRRMQELANLPSLPVASPNPAFKVISSKAPTLQRPFCLFTCDGRYLEAFGYWIGYRDTKAYDSTEFQRAARDVSFWKSLATLALECRRKERPVDGIRPFDVPLASLRSNLWSLTQGPPGWCDSFYLQRR